MIKKFNAIRNTLQGFIKGLPPYVELIVWIVVGIYFVLLFTLAIVYFVMWLKTADVKRLTELRLFIDMFSSPTKSVFMTGLLALLVDANHDGVPDPLEKNSTTSSTISNDIRKGAE